MRSVSLSFAAIAALFVTSSANAQFPTFAATINAAQEVPAPTIPGGYTGGGFGTVEILNPTSVRVNLNVTNLTSGVTVAHIHQAAPGVAGPVRLDLLPTTGLTSLIIVNRTYTVSNVFTSNFLAGVPYYFNVHTSNNPAGEVRGNLVSAPEPGTALLALLALPVAGVVLRRRSK